MTETVKKTKAPAKPKKSVAAETETAEKSIPAKKSAKAAKTAPASATAAPSQREIEQLAHRFWEEGGRMHGHHAEHWSRAEEALRKK